jgi:Tfp pilus assembly protein PilV
MKNNKGFSVVEAVAAMIILSVVLLAAYSMLSSSATRSEITSERVEDSTVSRGVANYINSFTFDLVDPNLSGEFAHINQINCSSYFTATCQNVLSPIVNNYAYTTTDLFVVLFRPTVNANTLKNSNTLYDSYVDDAIDKFSLNSEQGNVIYFIVVNKGSQNTKFIQRGILSEEVVRYAD